MGDAMRGILADAKKNKYSAIRSISEEDAASVWDSVSAFIEKNMTQQKGVTITGLGSFTFMQKKLDIGNGKFLLIQRPVFQVAEKFAQTHSLQFTKYHVPGNIQCLPLNYAALSFESPFDRDTVESCVKEILNAATRAISMKRNVELVFSGIGRLSIRECKVKMKFYKEFITEVDGSGKVMEAMKNRDGVADSVMSRCATGTTTRNTVLLPSLEELKKTGKKLSSVPEEMDGNMLSERAETLLSGFGDSNTAQILRNILNEGPGADTQRDVDQLSDNEQVQEQDDRRTAMVHAVDLAEDMFAPAPPQTTSPKRHRPPRSKSPKHQKEVHIDEREACGHADSGQEMCYLCHQRDSRNIPVSFVKERKEDEEEADKLLQQYQTLKDAEQTYEEQMSMTTKRHELQKIAAFNLGVSESIKDDKVVRDTEFHRSYIFQSRPLTPAQHFEQNLYSNDLAKQVQRKDVVKSKKQEDQDFLGRMEQVQLAEDLAAQREQYLQSKLTEQQMYRKSLDAQIGIRNVIRGPDGLLHNPQGHLLPYLEQKGRGVGAGMDKMRFKPLPLPMSQTDAEVFGKNDMNNEKMLERRRRAYDLFQEQQDLVGQTKRDEVLKRLSEQKDEEEMLKRTRAELKADRSKRHSHRRDIRKRLETDWHDSDKLKKHLEMEAEMQAQDAGMLLHEQCDKYKRCHQCKRNKTNCGESNIWSESRYIPGSRLMV